MRRSAGIAAMVTALGAATLTGCASSGSVSAAGGGPSTSAPTSPAGVIPTGPATTSTPPTGPGGTAAPPVGVTVTVSGTVIQGAEPSCLILKSDRGELELLSNKASVHSGDHVTATGHVVHVMSHCMQGQPFQVDSLTVG